jgi:dolichol-phosphate mannosyltransferase
MTKGNNPMPGQKSKTDDRILVIVPTYNEVDNIQRLIPSVLEQDPRVEILVVDDSSPDGTAEVVQRWTQKTPRVHLMKRPSKLGLGSAYVEGFRYALAHDFPLVMEMDADLSHDPRDLPRFIAAMANQDLVVGSRYLRGVNVINWPMSRLILSWMANKYTRWVTGLPLHDATSGYKCFRREVLKAINLDRIHSDGYSFQIEMDYKAWKLGFRVSEISIVFVDRSVGISKMSKDIVSEAAWMVWRLRFQSLFGK